jgi:hypothetical protein
MMTRPRVLGAVEGVGVGPVRSLRFSALIASTSSADNPKSKMSMFSQIRSGVTDLGKTDSGVSDIDPARCRPVYTAGLAQWKTS